jgi:hypothetical protein
MNRVQIYILRKASSNNDDFNLQIGIYMYDTSVHICAVPSITSITVCSYQLHSSTVVPTKQLLAFTQLPAHSSFLTVDSSQQLL